MAILLPVSTVYRDYDNNSSHSKFRNRFPFGQFRAIQECQLHELGVFSVIGCLKLCPLCF